MLSCHCRGLWADFLLLKRDVYPRKTAELLLQSIRLLVLLLLQLFVLLLPSSLLIVCGHPVVLSRSPTDDIILARFALQAISHVINCARQAISVLSRLECRPFLVGPQAHQNARVFHRLVCQHDFAQVKLLAMHETSLKN